MMHQALWSLAVLSPDPGPVVAVGDHNIHHALDAFGFDVISAGDPGQCQSLLIAHSLSHGCNDRGELLRPEADNVAVVLPAPSRLARSSRAGRLAATALAPVVERRIAQTVASTSQYFISRGFNCEVLTIGNDFPPSDLSRPGDEGRDVSRRWRDRPSGSAVVARRREPEAASVVDAAAAAAEAAVGPCTLTRTIMLESAKLLLYLRPEGSDTAPAADDVVVRLGVGPGARLIDQSRSSLQRLEALSPPDEVRKRLILPIDHGSLGPARYTVEPFATGHHPTSFDESTWDDCLEFLGALYRSGRTGATAADEEFGTRMEQWLKTISSFLGPDEAEVLATVAGRARPAIEDLPVGFTHGDMWPANLLMVADRLGSVLDWDWSSPSGLPLLDAMELRVTSDPASTFLSPGRRTIEKLWPMAEAASDRRIHEHARNVDCRFEPRTAKAATVAYWLERVSRDLRPYSSRPADRVWFEENVSAPLQFFRSHLDEF